MAAKQAKQNSPSQSLGSTMLTKNRGLQAYKVLGEGVDTVVGFRVYMLVFFLNPYVTCLNPEAFNRTPA